MNGTRSEEILWRHLRDLPYFRAMVRAVEDSFYQGLELPAPVLDLGCGDGHFASVAFDHPLDVGLDPWWGPLLEARYAPCLPDAGPLGWSQNPVPGWLFCQRGQQLGAGTYPAPG